MNLYLPERYVVQRAPSVMRVAAGGEIADGKPVCRTYVLWYGAVQHHRIRERSRTMISQEPRPESADGERELIGRVCDGDQEAFYELVRPYERAIYFAARSVLENDADAEEAAQDAVLKAFTHIRDFRAESKFSTWLVQITINTALMKLRKDHRHLYQSLDEPRTNEEGDYWPSDFADWREIPSEALETKELRMALRKALNALPEIYRQVLLCRDVQQLNIAETAKVLGISEANVRTRLLRARLQMRDALAPGFDGSWNRGRSYEKVRAW